MQPVLGDHLLVGGGGGRGRAADLAQLGPVVTARGDDHVAAVVAHLVDDRTDLRVRRHRIGAVPGRRAAAAGQDEGHLEGLLAGGRHDLPEVGTAGVQRAVVGSRLIPVGAQRRGLGIGRDLGFHRTRSGGEGRGRDRAGGPGGEQAGPRPGQQPAAG